MKTFVIVTAALVATATSVAAQERPLMVPIERTPSATGGKLSVDTSTVAEIMQNPRAKAALEKASPGVTKMYGLVATNTPAELQARNPTAFTPAKLKELQAEFDKIG